MNKVKSFFFGMLAFLGSLFFEMIFVILLQCDSDKLACQKYSLFIYAIIEETLKAAVLAKALQITRSKNWPVYSLAIGLGFSASEAALYSSQLNFSASLIFPYLGLAALHIATSLLSGLFLSRHKITHPAIVIILAINFFIHIFYNLYLAPYYPLPVLPK